MIPNVQLMTKSPAENTSRKSRISKGKNCDGQNWQRMKLPIKLAPRFIPPQLSKKKISIFFSRKPYQIYTNSTKLLPIAIDIPERACLDGHSLHIIHNIVSHYKLKNLFKVHVSYKLMYKVHVVHIHTV